MNECIVFGIRSQRAIQYKGIISLYKNKITNIFICLYACIHDYLKKTFVQFSSLMHGKGFSASFSCFLNYECISMYTLIFILFSRTIKILKTDE